MIEKWAVKRKCKDPKYLVIVNIQGSPFYYEFNDLNEAFKCYAEKIKFAETYGTSNISLRQVLITDEL